MKKHLLPFEQDIADLEQIVLKATYEDNVNEICRLFQNSLKQYIRNRVIGGVSVHIHKDTLTVTILYDNTPMYSYIEYDIFDKIYYGLQANELGEKLVTAYRKKIFSKYFTKSIDKKPPYMI